MPVKSPEQWGMMGAARSGKVAGIAPTVAKEFMDKTPVNKRKAFAKALRKKKKR